MLPKAVEVVQSGALTWWYSSGTGQDTQLGPSGSHGLNLLMRPA